MERVSRTCKVSCGATRAGKILGSAITPASKLEGNSRISISFRLVVARYMYLYANRNTEA